MRKKLIALALVLVLGCGVVSVRAAGGSANDPLLSLSYLKNTVKPQLISALQTALYPTSGTGRSAAKITG